MSKIYYVYIVECSDATLYTGIATDVKRRIQEHNTSTKGAKYTKARRPVQLVYMQECTGRIAAAKREYEIKHYSRSKKLQLIQSYAS